MNLPPSLPPVGGDQPKEEVKNSKETPKTDLEKEVTAAALAALHKAEADGSLFLKERKLSIEEKRIIHIALSTLTVSHNEKSIEKLIQSSYPFLSKIEWALFAIGLTRIKDKYDNNKLNEALNGLLIHLFYKIDDSEIENKDELLTILDSISRSKEDLAEIGQLMYYQHPKDRNLLIRAATAFIGHNRDLKGLKILENTDEATRLDIANALLNSDYPFVAEFLAANLGQFVKEEAALKLANILIEKAPYHLCENVENLGITKQELLSELFKRLATVAFAHFGPRFKNYKMDEKIKLEIVEIWKNNNLGLLIRYIPDFRLSPEARFKIARELLTGPYPNYILTIQDLDKFAIEPVSKRIELAQIIAQAIPERICFDFDKFEIEPVSKRIEFAQALIQQQPDSVCRNIHKFKIEPESKRIEFAHLLLQQTPIRVCDYLEKFAIKDRRERFDLAMKLSRTSAKETLYRRISDFDLDEKQRIEVLRSLIANFSLDTEELGKFQISDPQILFELAKLAAAFGLISNLQQIFDFGIKDPKHLYEAFSYPIISSLQCAKEGQFLEKLLPQPTDVPVEYQRDLAAKALAYYPEPDEKDLALLEKEKNSIAAELYEKIQKHTPSKAAVKDFGLDKARKHEQNILTHWLGYYLTCCRLLEISDKELRPFQGMLEQIFSLRNPALRYQLTYELISAVKKGRITAKEAKSLATLRNPAALFSFLLLIPLMSIEPKTDWSSLLRTLERSTFYNRIDRQMDAIKSIQAIMNNPIWSLQQKQKLFRTIFPMSGLSEADQKAAKLNAHHLSQRAKKSGDLESIKKAKEAQALVEQKQKEANALPALLHTNLEAVHTLIRQGGHVGLTNLLQTAPEATFERASLLTSELNAMVPSLFSDKLGFEITTKEGSNYDALRPERNRNALFVYAGGLNTLPPQEKKATQAYLKSLVESVLTNTYHAFRYVLNNKHLQEVLSKKEALSKNWQTGDSIPFEQLRIQHYLHEKIVKDRHLNPSDFSFITEYLKSQNAITREAIKKSLKSKLDQFKEGSKEFKHILIQFTLIKVIHLTNSVARQRLLEFAALQAKEVDEIEFHQDIKNLNAQAIYTAAGIKTDELVVQDTDEFQDLLLIGTDVDMSCQRVTFDSEKNKALLAYIGDGKIRAIVVKNKEGRILARRILRILVDSNSGEPVLVREKLYSVNGIGMSIELAVDAMTIRRAHSLGLPLLGARDIGINYSNDLLSLGSPAPFEYLDTGGARMLQGPYSIPNTEVEVIWEPKKDKGT